jgi:hypothetical protein
MDYPTLGRQSRSPLGGQSMGLIFVELGAHLKARATAIKAILSHAFLWHQRILVDSLLITRTKP